MKSLLSFPTSRRRFLALAAGSCGAVSLGMWTHRASGKRGSLAAYSRRSQALGAAVTMTVLHRDRGVAEDAMEAAFAELERIEEVMSLYRPDSELSRLNREGHLNQPDPRLVEVLAFASEISAKSGGAFDVTVQPLWSLHAKAREEGRLPEEAELSAAAASVNWHRVDISKSRVTLHGSGTAVTLNGIAQGFAADAAMRVLRAHGVKDALIDTGELGALGRNPEGAPWRIGIQHPRQREAFATLAKLENRCLATSGDYESAFSEDFSRNHIFDPRTGCSPGELASVSVLAPSAMEADGLSTALFVMGAERGVEFLRTFPGTDALLILKNGQRLMTEGFPAAA